MAVSSFETREIAHVGIDHLRTGKLDDGQEIIKAHVQINVADAYTPGKLGPGVKVEIGLLPDRDMTVREIERAALSAAHDLLARLANEPFADLYSRFQRDRES